MEDGRGMVETGGEALAPVGAGRGPAWAAWAGLAAAAAVAWLAYLPSLDGGFQYDDARNIETNLQLKDLGQYLGHTFWATLGRGGRAVADLTFAVNYAQGGLEPRPYHLTSVAFHLLAMALVFLLGRRLLERVGWARPEWPALAAAALWGLHPLQSQAVSYIVQRAEVLASLGYAGAVLLTLEAARRGRRGGGAWWLGAAVLLAAALLAELGPRLLGEPRDSAGEPIG